MSNIYVGDTTNFVATLPLDISTANTKQFTFEKPDKSTLTVSGTFVNTGVDGQVQYLCQPTDLDTAGFWSYQVYIAMPGNLQYHSSVTYFRVLPNLPI